MTQPVSDKWIKCISDQGSIRGVALQATQLVRSVASMHHLTGIHAEVLGEALMGALMVASYCKTGEQVNLNVRGSGYSSQALVDAHPDGAVRGYLLPRSREEAFFGEGGDTGPWGVGTLSVLRTKGKPGTQPYIGTVPLVTGFLAKDLTFYWLQSEQVPSAVGLAVKTEGDEVVAAGGFLIQAMPQASLSEIKAIEQNIKSIKSLSEDLTRDADPLHHLAQIFQNATFMIVQETPLKFKCHCSQERAERALALSGAAELRDILKNERKASIRCDFCTKEYTISAKDLERLLASSA